MSKINVLTEDLINKIAAGEVIERPASVVKELVENSLDASSTRITVEIKDSGKKLIKVSDNGEGMSEEDAKLSIVRHSTSKIREVNDLFAINTLGFRGEALASMAAVSQLSIITKQESEVEAFNLVVEGGNMISSGVLSGEKGTTIEVRNIFFNTPARKKFQKSDAVELRHILDVVIHYALMNPEISFRVKHEGHELLNSPAVENMKDNIASIYGVSLAKDLIEVNYGNEYVIVKGHIAKPHQVRNDKNQQAIFVNGRWVKNEEISRAVYDAYHSTLFVNKHPVFVLSLELDPKKIDVNVHPNKSQIKIEQKKEIYEAVKESIRRTLENNNLIPVLGRQKEEGKQETLGSGGNISDEVKGKKKETNKESKYVFEPSKQSALKVEDEVEDDFLDEDDSSEDLEEFEQLDDIQITKEEKKEYIKNIVTRRRPTNESYATPEGDVIVKAKPLIHDSGRFPVMKLLGQIHKTFFVAETLGGLYYIDQHAAHERVLYERFMKQYMGKGVEVQKLLQGEMLEFTAAEKIIIEDNREELEKFGFTLEEFGGNTFIIKTIPLLFGRQQPKEIIYEVLTMLREGKQKLMETKEEMVTRMSCRAAVMAGEELTIGRMEEILKELAETELPFTCPHGRPTILKIDVYELEKMFKRV